MEGMISFLSTRIKYWKPILWTPLVGCLLGIYSILSFATWFRDEMVRRSPEAIVVRVIDLLPSLSLWTWLCIGLATLLVVALEGGFRHTGTLTRQCEDETSNEHAKYLDLRRRFESEKGPKITLAYEKTAIHKGFYMYADKDILNATVESTAAVRANLPYVIRAGVPVPLEFVSVKGDETEEGFERAFNEFCADQIVEASIPLRFHYWDHSGNEYEVRWFIIWSELTFAWGLEPKIVQDHASYRWIEPEAASRAEASDRISKTDQAS